MWQAWEGGAYRILVGRPEGRRTNRGIILKLIWKKLDRKAWDWIRLVQGRGKWRVAVNTVRTFGFYKMQGICCQRASQEVPCSMEVVNRFLTMLLVAQGISIEWRDDKLALDWKECRRKRSWLNLRHCPGVWINDWKEPTRHLCRGIRSLDRYLKLTVKEDSNHSTIGDSQLCMAVVRKLEGMVSCVENAKEGEIV
jgi:hypothetical protein